MSGPGDLGLPPRYEVVRELGRGGMATVYLARDRESGSEVALKVLHRGLREDALVVSRFKREMTAARRIRHPAVIAIYDLIDTPECLCLVLEHHPGRDCKRLLRERGKLPAEEVLAIARQVLGALSAAHAEGIVHRDVKPHNVLLDDRGAVKLADFGVARVDDALGLTRQTTVVGTPEYMAPEMLSSPLADGRADLYGLGVTLYELVAGVLPYRAATPMALFELHQRTEVPDVAAALPGVPPALARTIRRAMARDPEDRFQTADEMLRALEGGEVPAPAVASGALAPRACACGAPRLPGVAACLECGAQMLALRSRPGATCSVYALMTMQTVTDVLKSGRAFPLEQERAMNEEIEAAGGRLKRAKGKRDLRIQTGTARIAANLERADAEALAARLVARGVRAEVRASLREDLGLLFIGDPKARTPVRVLQAAGPWLGVAMALLPFLLPAIPGGSRAGFALGIFAWSIVWLAGLVAFARRPLAAFDGAEPARAELGSLEDRARAAFSAIRSPRLRSLVRRTLERGLLVRRRLAELRPDDTAALAEVDQLIGAALDAAAHAATLEARIAEADPDRLLHELRALEARIAGAATADAAAWIARKVEIERTLADRDEAEAAVVATTGRLVGIAAELRAAVEHLTVADTSTAGGRARLDAALACLSGPLQQLRGRLTAPPDGAPSGG